MNAINAVADAPHRVFKLDLSQIAPREAALALQRDDVVLMQGLTPAQADGAMLAVADHLGLRDQLELQAAFAAVKGHRTNAGKNFMSVNRRTDYQFISAHSEGLRNIGMQLAAFYCLENSTDGGHTLLLNVDSNSSAWSKLKDVTVKADLGGRTLPPADLSMARIRHQLFLPQDQLAPDDIVLRTLQSSIPKVNIYEVLARPQKTHSTILGREVYVYWDSIASTDSDSAVGYLRLLESLGLVRRPSQGADVTQLDNAHDRRQWRSGVDYPSIFKAMVCRKLAPGDLVIVNNMTWAHSATNWTPGSGVRSIFAAFA
jgi:hypothetical protein